MSSAQHLIKQLDLSPHPEGGYYRRTYQSEMVLRIRDKTRYCSTLIYYLLQGNDISVFHRLKSDEIWIYQQGAAIKIHILKPDGSYEFKILGNNILDGESLQVIIPAGLWFAAELVDKNDFSLASCVVSPGFDFEDFSIAAKAELLADYPKHKDLISKFT